MKGLTAGDRGETARIEIAAAVELVGVGQTVRFVFIRFTGTTCDGGHIGAAEGNAAETERRDE